MNTRRWIAVAAGVVMLVPMQVNAAQPAEMQGDWSAWYGCWRAMDMEEGVAPLVCVLPGDEPSAVRIATIEGGEITDETIVRADGIARPIEEGGCTGAETAFFSSDGRRVFTRAELACSGLGRTSTGVLALVSPGEWIDAQALTVNGQHAARTIRYSAVSASDVPGWIAEQLPQGQDLALEAARLNAAMPLDVPAVVEASKHVAPPAVEALLAARQHGFGLDGEKLVQLRESGVPTSTIDVMVALSYPQKFAVQQTGASPQPVADLARGNAAAAWVDDCYDPYGGSRRYSCYDSRYGSRYGYGYGYSRGRYGYSPYGYDPYGWNYGSRPVIVIVQPDEQVDEGGSVVKGRGYTRSGSSRGTAAPRAGTRSSGEGSTVRASGSPPTASPPSTSSGTTKPKRTAKPRGSGGH